MVYYDSAAIYVESAKTLKEKITRIDAIITALETQALVAAGNSIIQEYSLDDGQTKIRTMYKSAKDVALSIDAFEAIKQRYINQLNGRMTRLVDGKNFTNIRNYGTR
jgi:hypothetical protein